MKKYGIYLFDFDYTLVDSSAGVGTCFQNVLERNGYRNVTDENIKCTIGKTLEDSFRCLTGETDPDALKLYKQQYISEANVRMTDNTRLFPETRDVLSELKNRHSKIGIVSTKYRYTIMELVGRDFDAGCFDIVVGCEDVSEPKPSPQGVFHALDRLGGERHDTLYTGDSVIDAELARAAGIDFVGVLHGPTTRYELAFYPYVEIGNDLTMLLG